MQSLLLGMLLEDQQELMLRRKPGAKTHGISHRHLLQHLPASAQSNTTSGTGNRDRVWPWLPTVLCRCLPSSLLGHMWLSIGILLPSRLLEAFWYTIFLQAVLQWLTEIYYS